jgi:hypothetical protein
MMVPSFWQLPAFRGMRAEQAEPIAGLSSSGIRWVYRLLEELT